MAEQPIFLAGRYNKFLRNLSQTPWVDKQDKKVKSSVQDLIEFGIFKYLNFSKCVFSSSGREDVDVRMLGSGRPFVIKLVEPMLESITDKNIHAVQDYINTSNPDKVKVRDLQIVTKTEVANNLKEGEEYKQKLYRALCCCSRKLTKEDIVRINSINNLVINQSTPIRVLHRRSPMVRNKTIFNVRVEDRESMLDYSPQKPEHQDNMFVISLLTEAGTYIKEFVHGDFGRTKPNVSTILGGNCHVDLLELDVMEIYLDWPKSIPPSSTMNKLPHSISDHKHPSMSTDQAVSNESLDQLYKSALSLFKKAEDTPSQSRNELLIECQRLIDRCQSIIESLDLFSKNETLDDVNTESLKYLLLPAIQAKIICLSNLASNRLQAFEKARQNVLQFFEKIIHLGLAPESIGEELKHKLTSSSIASEDASLQNAIKSRDAKIAKYKKMKLLQDELECLEQQALSNDNVDEEMKRKYYLKLLDKWIDDTLESLNREIKPAIFFEESVKAGVDFTPKPIPTASIIKPTTIVRDELQKQVFGMGYPARPTVTVDEFISKKIKDGDLAFHAQKEIYSNSLQRYAEQPTLMRDQEESEQQEREELDEREDASELSRKRAWDEFKDENPRGSGNRHNMG